jgi:phage terminase large subunit GpA-like protein
MRTFAEEEIVLPTGPRESRRFRCRTQPFTGLWFDGIDSGCWPRAAASGPRQASKTLIAFVIVILYHLFEVGETVIASVPRMEMAAEKWHADILPVIERSRFRDMLPTKGRGSKGAWDETFRFRNGRTLKWISFGDAANRPAFAARVVVFTEVDDSDSLSATSDEGDRISRVVACTRSFSTPRVYMECITKTAAGRINREIVAGTDSRIHLPCPHCRSYVEPGRKHVVGWEKAASVLEAMESARFSCPKCGKPWSEEERFEANRRGVLLHRGQTVRRVKGKARAVGAPPKTDTFGLRWSAVHNHLLSVGHVAADLYTAAQDPDDDNAERNLCQIVFAVPYTPPIIETAPLERKGLMRRVTTLPRGRVPAWCEYLTVSVDVGKWICYYIAIAWKADGTGHIVDYGTFEVKSKDLGVEVAILAALRTFRDDVCLAGWAQSGEPDRKPDQVWVDAGYQTDVVKGFCRESGKRFRPTLGRGAGQRFNNRPYALPKSTGAVIRQIGDGYHISWYKRDRVHVVEINADLWKSWVHERLTCPVDRVGAMTLFAAPPNEHISFSMHLTAERQVEEFIPNRGTMIRWELKRKANHWFDCAYAASTAAHFCGVRLATVSPPGPVRLDPKAEPVPAFRTPSGQPFLITER